jgi:hypothetical protein
MIWALFRFLKIGLKWPDRQALGGALLTSLYFVTLRISWDLYRNMLGLTFILLSLPLIEDMKGIRKQALLSALIVLAVAANQLTGVLALVLLGARALKGSARNQQEGFLKMTGVALPGMVLLLATAYAALIVPGIGLVRQQAPVPTITTMGVSLGFLGYVYLPLVPLILVGLRRVPNIELRTWSMFCCGIVVTALLPFFGPIVESYRWSLLLDIPLCVFAAAGIARLTSVDPNVRLGRWFQAVVVPTFSIIIVSSSILYIALPAQQAMPYFTLYSGLLTTSMVQDTVPLSDMSHLHDLLDWVNARSGSGSVLITHQAIYGWARAYQPSEPIINYQYSSPLEGVRLARLAGYSSIMMIWWVNGTGWHDQPTIPIGFTSLIKEGNLEVYTYQ